MYYITGDTHRDFRGLKSFISKVKTTKEDVVIILGDAGINYFLDERDIQFKKELNELNCTFACVKGNHELHADEIDSYEEFVWNGAVAYREKEFDNIIFLKDGEIYNINGKDTLVIGGAYSVDKYRRLMYGYRWFETEQPSLKVQSHCLSNLAKHDWKVDVILSHTAPISYEPVHLFLNGINQKDVDKTTEEFLEEIKEKTDFKKWYFGHYHGMWKVDKFQLMFNDIEEF